MNYIPRIPKIKDKIEKNKVLLIFGPRQIGKTFLVNKYIEESGETYLKLFGEDLDVKSVLSVPSSSKLLDFFGSARNIFLDEAQQIPNIGTTLKLLIDLNLGFTFIVTGSSSFELVGQVGEPLVGRYNLINLFPLSYLEIKNSYLYNPLNHLNNFLLYGGYPEVVKTLDQKNKIEKLENITNSYLLKDIFIFEKIKKPDMLLNLLKLLAYQIGSEVNINEIAIKLEVGNATVERYIDILEKSFIIKRLYPYAKSLRNEIKRKTKIYFLDLGIRNSLIDDFSNLNFRRDIGNLFENFLVIERLKRNTYGRHYTSSYFWRDVHSGEVDYLEIDSGVIKAYEFTYNNLLNKKKINKMFTATYGPTVYQILDKDNFLPFISP
jgi:predicted AAA+ superfamily ATPase